MTIRAVLFDFDMTLIDTSGALLACLASYNGTTGESK